LADINAKFLKSLINKCPATILADNRTERVIGRIKFLISSIITIKFIRAVGVPVGTMWIIIFFELFTHPNNIIESHIIIAVVNEIEIWAVGVKIKGNKAIKFIKIIDVKIDFINSRFPFLILLENKLCISLLIFELIVFTILIQDIFILYLLSAINIIGNMIDIQDKLKIEDDGSKILNKLFIIFI